MDQQQEILMLLSRLAKDPTTNKDFATEMKPLQLMT